MSSAGAALDRLVDRVEVDGDCWLWRGAHDRLGYGMVTLRDPVKRTQVAHRFVYELLVGPIPPGLTLDHLCRRRDCVNPDHVEPVPFQVNVLRGVSPAAIHAVKTQCLRGHPFVAPNLRIGVDGYRYCRACDRLRRQRRAA